MAISSVLVFPRRASVLALVFGAAAAFGAVVEQDVTVKAETLETRVRAAEGAPLDKLMFVDSGHEWAAGLGLLQDGLGQANPYAPSRRLNGRLELPDGKTEAPSLTYTYDCEGPHIEGLRVTRVTDWFADESSVRVRWRVENKGTVARWLSPWARHELMPGGAADEDDRIDAATLEGIRRLDRAGYVVAARNWIAVTDPVAKETVYAVYDADTTHSFLAEPGGADAPFAIQTAFIPRSIEPGSAWEAVYRVGAVRGLTHIDFATDELAAQMDYEAGTLTLRLSSVKALPQMELDARVLAANGEVWRLGRKRFTLNGRQVVRCTYEWTAPGPGRYEFLGQVVVNQQPYALGKETHSPHGGIDTQFSVGGAGGALEPWTDAPYALERGKRALKRTLAADGPLQIWFERSLEKVFRDDEPAPSGEVKPVGRIQLARGERESIQVVLRPKPGVKPGMVNLRFNGLTHASTGVSITGEDIEVANVLYHDVRVPTHFEGPTGAWPDALPPFQPFVAPEEQCSAVWITVHAPRRIPPGLYTGMIEVQASGVEPVELWLEAEVYDFDLPRTPLLKTDFGFLPEAAVAQARRLGGQRSLDQLAHQYWRSASDHRVTLRALAQLPAESADYPASLRAFETRLPRLEEFGTSTFYAPVSLLETPEQLILADAFVKDKGLSGRAFTQIAEEPAPPEWPRVYDRMTQWQELAPEIPIMITAMGLQPFLPEKAEIWAPHAPMLNTVNNRIILQGVEEGREIWWYVNETTGRPHGNFYIDYAAMDHRILFWQTWALGLKGMHYGPVNRWPEDGDPYVSLLDTVPANGSHALFYPGSHGPVNSIRWETIRDGIEDFDYLTLLSQAIRQAKEKNAPAALIQQAEEARNLKALMPSLAGYSSDPAVLEAARDRIARAIVALHGALEGIVTLSR